jgi:hypothetical protein
MLGERTTDNRDSSKKEWRCSLGGLKAQFYQDRKESSPRMDTDETRIQKTKSGTQESKKSGPEDAEIGLATSATESVKSA